MRRSIPLLSGFAIILVMLNHVNWHVLRDLVPGPASYWPAFPYLLLDQVTKLSVPAFLFVAGYFVSYATSEGRKTLKWDVVRARLDGLFWPWIGWGLILTFALTFKDHALSFQEFIYTLFIQYYFIPLIIFNYLTAFLVVPLARNRPRSLLLTAGTIQVVFMGLYYLHIYSPGFLASIDLFMDVGPLQYLRFSLYFPLGLVAAIHLQTIRTSLARLKPFLPWLVLLFYGLQVFETSLAYLAGPNYYPVGGDHSKITSMLFTLSVLLFVMLSERMNVPFSRLLVYASANTFGFYLSHYVILGIISQLTDRFIPWLRLYSWLLLPIFFLSILVICTTIMEIFKRLPLRRYYHYVFG